MIVARGASSGDDVPMGLRVEVEDVVIDAFCGAPVLSAAVPEVELV